MIGSRISHYRIEEELGRGGMGVVYRAHDERLRRDVALKLLTLDPSNRERILSEARAAAALNHPGIITVYEVGEEGERVFLVMELLPGRTLRGMLAEGPLEPLKLLRLAAQVAEALAAAHARNVVHGDIKPENIVLSTESRAKILDFGIARTGAEEAVTMSRAHTAEALREHAGISGTLAYLAPEILRGPDSSGRGAAGDSRSDLFSFGVMLYELASGRRPFPGPTSAHLLSQILHEPAPPLADVAPTVPPELARIVHKLLEKDPDSRYQSAREVQVDLNNLLRDLELGPAPVAAVSGKKSVAVLPFSLLTPNPEDEYLSVALADAVINQLSASGAVLVRPTSMVRRYANREVDPRLAARELNVQVLIEGSIQKSGQRLRVHVQAWNAAEGSTFLSAKHDGEMGELFDLQDAIGGELRGLFELEGAVAKGLADGGKRSAEKDERHAPPTKHPMAYELYLRAADRLSKLNRWDTRTAIELLEQATNLDPRFAEAWARLAEAYTLLATTQEADAKWFRKADQAIRRALAINPLNAEAHCARGRVLWSPTRGFRNREALKALNKALQINPGCHPAQLWRCLIFLHLGMHEEAREGLLEALAMHPDDAFTLTFIGQAAFYRNDYEEADEFQARAIRADRAHIWANIFYPWVDIYRGRLEQAEERIRFARVVLPHEPYLATSEALIWALRGESRRALQTVERSLRGGKPLLHTHHMWHGAGAVYALLGKQQKATHWLTRAAKNGLPNYPLFRDEPQLQSLHTNAAFQKLLSNLKKEWLSYKKEFAAK